MIIQTDLLTTPTTKTFNEIYHSAGTTNNDFDYYVFTPVEECAGTNVLNKIYSSSFKDMFLAKYGRYNISSPFNNEGDEYLNEMKDYTVVLLDRYKELFKIYGQDVLNLAGFKETYEDTQNENEDITYEDNSSNNTEFIELPNQQTNQEYITNKNKNTYTDNSTNNRTNTKDKNYTMNKVNILDEYIKAVNKFKNIFNEFLDEYKILFMGVW